MIYFYWWVTLFGIWPLAHPEHNTFGNPVTWIDLVLHVIGLSVTLPIMVNWIRKAGV